MASTIESRFCLEVEAELDADGTTAEAAVVVPPVVTINDLEVAVAPAVPGWVATAVITGVDLSSSATLRATGTSEDMDTGTYKIYNYEYIPKC